jgi:hypothetical protein
MRVSIASGIAALGLMAANSPSFSQERSFLCKFTSGPRAGQVQDYTGNPQGPLPVGTPCQDGISSWGVIISASGGENGGSSSGGGSGGGGSCRAPSKEEDCDKCSSDKAYERCLEKAGSQ